MIQMNHPDPPVAVLPRWVLSIQWRQIFSGVLVTDYMVSRPVRLRSAALGIIPVQRSSQDGQIAPTGPLGDMLAPSFSAAWQSDAGHAFQ